MTYYYPNWMFWLPSNCYAPPRFRELPNGAGDATTTATGGGYPPQQIFIREQMQPYPPEFYQDFNRHFFPQPPLADYHMAYHRQPPFGFHFPPITSSEGPEQCQWMITEEKMCGLMFACKKDLVEHLQAQHIGVIDTALHECHWKGCDRSRRPFKAKYKLVNHVRVHTHEKPFVCEQCKKLFARSENMKIHMRTHTQEKPFPCTHPGCQKRFANSSDRKKHMHVHTDDKPYTCRYKGCGKTYTHPSSLRKHQKQHEKNNCTPDLDESSDSGHASSSTPGDDFPVKHENEMPQFPIPHHLLNSPYPPPPYHPSMFNNGSDLFYPR